MLGPPSAGCQGAGEISRVSVAHFLWDDRSDASKRILHVAPAPWNQVDMAMKNGLAGNCSDIRADVEALHRRIFFRNLRPETPQQIISGSEFRLRQIEVGRRMAIGENQRVEGGHRRRVADGKGELVS